MENVIKERRRYASDEGYDQHSGQVQSYTFSMIIMLWAFGCSCQKTQSGGKEAFEGCAWTRDAGEEDKSPFPLAIVFDEKGGYHLIFLTKITHFPGTYGVSEDVLRLIDFYCGTDLPGLYRYKMAKQKLHLELVEDEYCERRKICSREAGIV